MVGMGCQSFKVGRMCSLASFSEQPEVLENIVLGVCSDPRTGSTFSRLSYRQSKEAASPSWIRSRSSRDNTKHKMGFLPYVVVHRLHHTRLGLLNGDLEALGLAVASKAGGSMTDGTVRVHSDDGLAGFMFSGIHLSGVKPRVAGRRAGKWEVVNMGEGFGV